VLPNCPIAAPARKLGLLGIADANGGETGPFGVTHGKLD